MKTKRFMAQISKREEFKYVRLAESDMWTNVLMASGDIVGQPAMDALVQFGQSEGILVLADHITIWKSEEYFKTYGSSVKMGSTPNRGRSESIT